MISVLADASFPKSLQAHGTSRLHFEVVDAKEAWSDIQFAEYASAHGYDALAFLGRDTFAQQELVQRADDLSLCLIVTNTDDPVEAVEHLGEHAKTLLARIGPGLRLLILSHEVRVVHAPRSYEEA